LGLAEDADDGVALDFLSGVSSSSSS
jgi:hypothetical protein